MDALARVEAMRLALDTFGGQSIELDIMLACARQPSSARDLIGPNVSTANASYHFKVLRGRGLLRNNRIEPVRGAMRRVHTITPRGRKLLRQLGLDENASA